MDARGVSDDVEPLTGARVVREQSVPMHHSLSRPEVLHISQLERVVRLARHHIGSSLRVSHVHPITSFLSRVVNLRAARSRVVPVRDVVKILRRHHEAGVPQSNGRSVRAIATALEPPATQSRGISTLKERNDRLHRLH